MIRVSIYPKVYRGQAGFLVSWKEPNRAWPQRIFTESRAVAERLKAAAQRGADFDELNRILCA